MSRGRNATFLAVIVTGLSGIASAQQPGYSLDSTSGGEYSQSPVYPSQQFSTQVQSRQVSPGDAVMHYQQSRLPQPSPAAQRPTYQMASTTISSPGHHQLGPGAGQVDPGWEQGYHAHNACQCGHCSQEPSAFWTSYYRNNRWPFPHRAQDVMAVTRYFDTQRENGWRMHNTIGNAMFDAQTNCLTQAGKNHVESILRDNPADRKVVFVLQGRNQQQTAARVQSTELAISEILPVGDLPPVYLTDRDAPGSSGAYQTAVTAMMMKSVPVPRLTSNTGSNSGGSSSAPPSGN